MPRDKAERTKPAPPTLLAWIGGVGRLFAVPITAKTLSCTMIQGRGPVVERSRILRLFMFQQQSAGLKYPFRDLSC